MGAVVWINNYLQFQFTSLKCQTDVRASGVAKITSGLKCVLTPSERRIERERERESEKGQRVKIQFGGSVSTMAVTVSKYTNKAVVAYLNVPFRH